MTAKSLDECPTIEIEDALVRAHEAECRAVYEQLTCIRELARRDAHLVDGARSIADWLSYRLGWSNLLARQRVAMARALDFLPAIGDALFEGHLTEEKAMWLASVATPEEDAELASSGEGMSHAEVRTFAQQRQRMTREKADARYKRRSLRIVEDKDEGVVRLWGRLADADGIAVKTAIERLADQAPRDPETNRRVALDVRCADALVEICSRALGADDDPDRATVVVHVDAAELASADGTAILGGDLVCAAETARRLLCDGRLQAVVHDAEGMPISVSRVARTIPSWMERELRARDRGCVFVGCSSGRWTHAHHIEHVAHGGKTEMSNLLLLCPYHHGLVHQGGWTVSGSADAPTFVRPDGTPLLARAP